jgi:conjugative relaxase-like TrwC/TraI family protein
MLDYTERNIAEARVAKGNGQQVERTGMFVATSFLHDVTRSGDPQLHVHTVIANATRQEDDQWRPLRSNELYDRQDILAAAFATDLRARVDAHAVCRPPYRGFRVHRHDRVGHRPIKQAAHAGELLLNTRQRQFRP